MKTFKQWAEVNKFELPVMTDSEDAQTATSENGKRTGIGGQYPDAYVRGQYQPAYFPPIKATAAASAVGRRSRNLFFTRPLPGLPPCV